MTGSDRRADIIQQIKESRTPVSGTKLALRYEVSRQVIVQDIALIRASGYDIISTNRGYILNAPKSVSRDFKVQHTDEQLEEELCAIVDLGGCVENQPPGLWPYGGSAWREFQKEGGRVHGRYPQRQVKPS